MIVPASSGSGPGTAAAPLGQLLARVDEIRDVLPVCGSPSESESMQAESARIWKRIDSFAKNLDPEAVRDRIEQLEDTADDTGRASRGSFREHEFLLRTLSKRGLRPRPLRDVPDPPAVSVLPPTRSPAAPVGRSPAASTFVPPRLR